MPPRRFSSISTKELKKPPARCFPTPAKKRLSTGRQCWSSRTKENFAKLANFLGYNVSIVTTPPSVCGIARCGENLGGATEANYYWITIVDGARLSYARCGTAVCGEVLCRITWAEDLECLLNRIKPAHTIIKLSYATPKE